ncbi:hypothetical protein MAR_021631 [Mya arenaria]|uniref:CxC5 like cysteine cluster associated with KDZ domain-containing protein n=1 Tax=Mya arenaria TaxID=6604 RepID=A0ABY7E8D3_MYAAR|nr:hypothetical protein MAR_021631 [Mya arenaria]
MEQQTRASRKLWDSPKDSHRCTSIDMGTFPKSKMSYSTRTESERQTFWKRSPSPGCQTPRRRPRVEQPKLDQCSKSPWQSEHNHGKMTCLPLYKNMAICEKIPDETRLVDCGAKFKTVLWKASRAHKEPLLNFIAPVVDACLIPDCGGKVYPASKSNITLFKITGPEPGLKCSLRCRSCGARYYISHYTIPNVGRRYYDVKYKTSQKESSNWVNHAFVSHKAFAEIYNGVYDENRAPEFHEWKKATFAESRSAWPVMMVMMVIDGDGVCQDDEYLGHGMKMALNSFFACELEKEIDERNLTAHITFNQKNTENDVLGKIDQYRRDEIYPHSCSANCKKKGCENLRVIDACWKLNIFHCLMSVPQHVDGYPLLSFPNVCVNEPRAGSVFCQEHFQLLQRNGVPTEKKSFLQHVGCKGADSTSQMEAIVMAFAGSIQQTGQTAIEYQGMYFSLDLRQGTKSMVLRNRPSSWESSGKSLCNKDIGQKGKLRQKSRGHFMCVTGGGHIIAESPSQVFMQTIKVIYEDVRHVPHEHLDSHLETYFLVYDNMCHLDSLRGSKVIDRLHLSNHKNKKCHTKYNPDVLPAGYNTQAAEQTFSWLGRFKKVVNSMTQMHHLFYLHRMIKRRNSYTEICRKKQSGTGYTACAKDC